VDASLLAQQNQQQLQQMGQDMKKTPELAEAMRQEVLRLNEELKLSDRRHEEQMQAVQKQLQQQQALAREQEALTKQGFREMSKRQPADSGSLPPADIPGSTPAGAAGRDGSQKLDYDASVRQGVSLLQNGDSEGAMRLAQQLIKSQPDRWEAYSIAGSVARVQNRPSQARSMFEKALSLAPEESKPSLQQALQEVTRGGQ
jgi:tetratricopeptide (TPR) repeat protein